MIRLSNIYRKAVTRRGVFLGTLGILLVVLLVAAACGDDDTPTPRPATATPRPQATATPVPATATPRPTVPTATPVPGAPTPTPEVMEEKTPTPRPATATPVPATATPAGPAGIRAMSEWTVENPATLEEIEFELEKHRGESFVFVSWGGSFQAAQRQAYLDPFQEKFGIEIIEDSPPWPYSLIAIQSETGNITWDIADIGIGGGGLAEAGQLEEYDFSIMDNRSWVEAAKSPFHGGGGDLGSDMLLFNLVTWPDGGPQPTSAADFFDLDRFPGNRGIYSGDFGWKNVIRFAYLAANPELIETEEGKAQLVTLEQDEIDAAYEVMEEFWPKISVFQVGVNDCFQLIAADELDMCMGDNSGPLQPIKDGAPIAFCWSCGHFGFADVWVTPRGLAEQAPTKFELIQLFMAWTMFPERNAEISRYIAVGPINLDSTPFLEGPEYDEFRAALPTGPAGAPYLVLKDAESDGKIQAENIDRFLEWITTGSGGG